MPGSDIEVAHVRDVLPTLEGWVRDGRRVVVCTVVRTERSAPRLPGSVMAVSDTGEVAGSVTGGLRRVGAVRPDRGGDGGRSAASGDLRHRRRRGLRGRAARAAARSTCSSRCSSPRSWPASPTRSRATARWPTSPRSPATRLGNARLVTPGPDTGDPVAAAARPLLALGESGVVTVGDDELFVSALVPAPGDVHLRRDRLRLGPGDRRALPGLPGHRVRPARHLHHARRASRTPTSW